MNGLDFKKLTKRVLRKVGLLKRRNGQAKSIRKDVEVIPIQPGLELVVYWKVLKIGKGPAVILKAFDKEIMKFDTFGKDKGHYHVAPHYNFRIYFPEEKALDQIKRTAFELRNNAQKYLALQPEKQIKKIVIDQESFSQAVQKAEEKMIYFLQNFPSFRERR